VEKPVEMLLMRREKGVEKLRESWGKAPEALGRSCGKVVDDSREGLGEKAVEEHGKICGEAGLKLWRIGRKLWRSWSKTVEKRWKG